MGYVSGRKRQTKSHCKNGHIKTAENTLIDYRGYDRCRVCSRAANESYRRSSAGKRSCYLRNTRFKQYRQAMLTAYKSVVGCAVCRTEDGQLHFHHTEKSTRIAPVSNMIMTAGIQKLADEINKCLVLCPDCHTQWHRENISWDM